jgi:hypothetical protein
MLMRMRKREKKRRRTTGPAAGTDDDDNDYHNKQHRRLNAEASTINVDAAGVTEITLMEAEYLSSLNQEIGS